MTSYFLSVIIGHFYSPQFNKNTAVIRGGWRLQTTKTSSAAYSIYSATLQPQELEFLSFEVCTPHIGNHPMQCRLLHICCDNSNLLCCAGGPAVNFIKNFLHLFREQYNICVARWGCSSAGLERLPVTQKVAGSSPVNPARN